jgi:tRNA (cmo5U34)-methyltransferase
LKRDDIYKVKSSLVGDFAFDESVAEVFPDMIARSVPGYASILAMIGELAARYTTPNSNIYDLGCSLGAATRIILQRVSVPCRIVAVDNSDAMMKRFGSEFSAQAINADVQVESRNEDIRDTSVRQASFVVLNLTLQFISIDDRRVLLQQIYDGMMEGGALLIAEKIRFEDPVEQELLTELHHDFKRSNGYSDLEIAQKRIAIENRLVPETLPAHFQRLSDVGFSTVVPWFQCFNFASFLAVK